MMNAFRRFVRTFASAVGILGLCALGAAAQEPAQAQAPAPARKKEGPGTVSSAGSAPAGLSGIDLSIWKAEQREKNKGS